MAINGELEICINCKSGNHGIKSGRCYCKCHQDKDGGKELYAYGPGELHGQPRWPESYVIGKRKDLFNFDGKNILAITADADFAEKIVHLLNGELK
jgi:hypothetical protein